MLLPSEPDMFHSLLLHKTLISTQKIYLLSKIKLPRKVFCLAEADCKFRAPLTPHIAQYNYNTAKQKYYQAIFLPKGQMIEKYYQNLLI